MEKFDNKYQNQNVFKCKQTLITKTFSNVNMMKLSHNMMKLHHVIAQ